MSTPFSSRRGGVKFKVSERNIVRLPKIGRASEYVRILGITTMTMWYWYKRYGLPVIRSQDAVLIDRNVFRTWLKKTGRYKPA